MSLDDKVLEGMHRMESLYNETEGNCFISFSGGKDSTVLLALAKMCAEICTLPADGIKAVFSNTGIEMGVTVDFVKWCKENWYPNIEMIRPEVSFDYVLKAKGKPLKSKLRSEFLERWQRGDRGKNVMLNLVLGITKEGKPANRTVLADSDMHMLHDGFQIKASAKCCDLLKKKPFKRYQENNGMKGCAYGIRQEEGGVRRINIQKRLGDGGKICTGIDRKGFIKKSPIVDWTDQDVDDFIKKYNVPISKAYTDYGFDRTGCMACPYGSTVQHNLRYLHDHEPNRYKASMHWLKDVYIAQNVVLPFDEEYEREREYEHGPKSTNQCVTKCWKSTGRTHNC